VAARGVVGGKDRHLEWWQRTAHGDGGTAGFARIRLNLDPESVDLYDYLDMDWFTVPRREKRRYVYGPYVDFSGADSYVLAMTVPVFDPGGARDAPAAEFLGVAGADLRMSHLEPELLAVLRSIPAPAVLVTAERRVIAANTPRWISGTRLDRLPAPGDQLFAAVTPIGADSGWLLAAAASPRLTFPTWARQAARAAAPGRSGADGCTAAPHSSTAGSPHASSRTRAWSHAWGTAIPRCVRKSAAGNWSRPTAS
jgi:hypothetical protein